MLIISSDYGLGWCPTASNAASMATVMTLITSAASQVFPRNVLPLAFLKFPTQFNKFRLHSRFR